MTGCRGTITYKNCFNLLAIKKLEGKCFNVEHETGKLIKDYLDIDYEQ